MQSPICDTYQLPPGAYTHRIDQPYAPVRIAQPLFGLSQGGGAACASIWLIQAKCPSEQP